MKDMVGFPWLTTLEYICSGSSIINFCKECKHNHFFRVRKFSVIDEHKLGRFATSTFPSFVSRRFVDNSSPLSLLQQCL